MGSEFYAAAPFGVTPEITKLVMELGRKAAPKSAPKPARLGPTAEVEQAVARGEFPPRLLISSETNPGYQKRADRLHALAAAGDVEALKATKISGVNSYSKALALYRAILVRAVAEGVPA